MHVILFDIDGTLLNSGGAGQAAMEAAIAELFGPQRAIEGISFAGRTDRGIIEDIFRYYGFPLHAEMRVQFLDTYLRHLPNELDRHPGLILPGVAEILAHLHARNDVTLGLLTGNVLEGARRKLTHFGLHEYFDFALGAFGDFHACRNDVARRAWEIVREIPEIGGLLEPNQIWIVGDTPADIQCAKAIGARSLAVATGTYDRAQLVRESPDMVIDQFWDARELIDDWVGEWLGGLSGGASPVSTNPTHAK